MEDDDDDDDDDEDDDDDDDDDDDEIMSWLASFGEKCTCSDTLIKCQGLVHIIKM